LSLSRRQLVAFAAIALTVSIVLTGYYCYSSEVGYALRVVRGAEQIVEARLREKTENLGMEIKKLSVHSEGSDLANPGVDGADWCVVMTFVYQCSADQQWHDARVFYGVTFVGTKRDPDYIIYPPDRFPTSCQPDFPTGE
jgi:hypothetical protein